VNTLAVLRGILVMRLKYASVALGVAIAIFIMSSAAQAVDDIVPHI